MIVMRNPPQIPSNSNLTTVEYTHWSRNVTLRLIDEYGKNYKDVGSRIRSYKILYEMIAEILNTEFQLKLTGSQVNNKFQTLIRSYKAVVDNNKKTGRGRKYFEFEEQMDNIFHKSKRINPEILLTETEVIRNTPRACNDTPTLQRSVHEVIDEPDEFINEASGCVEDERKTAVKKTTTNLKRKGTRTDVLEDIRSDKQKFYENYIQIQNSKIAEQKRKNDLLEEKNKLLKEYLANNSR
ncbi:Myeloid differentiation primary response protein MyD88 [Aphis craccivora]|uniref:Myeloid differentiation primary response protein MyD88 n=1 Tax=Aphis craccivora TaxID=307492 RepID=A0A6G0XGC3_APHCR|nr:Myeloid differentiation primary response protein MyD88 [Aphis craccivora]